MYNANSTSGENDVRYFMYKYNLTLDDWNQNISNIYKKVYIDGHESKQAIFILAIVQESRNTSAFRYFSTYSFYFIT